MTTTPMLDKMAKVQPVGQAIGEFLDWAAGKGFVLAYAHEHDDGCYVPHEHKDYCLTRCQDRPDRVCGMSSGQMLLAPSLEGLLAEFFGVDLTKAEAEKRAILASLRGGA